MTTPTRRIYLDYNATTPLAGPVREAMTDALGVMGNPSSLHEEGREARDQIETARRQVAAMLGGQAEDLVFTSGGTEADCLGVIGLARAGLAAGRPPRALVAAVEHPAVHGAVAALAEQGVEPVTVAVDQLGRLDLEDLSRAAQGGGCVLAVGLANHELGAIQDLPAITSIARERDILVHCDAVQAIGKIPVDAAALGADAVAVSAHKFCGPKGAGALWIRSGLALVSLCPGGHQERERRAGTENLPGIVGMGCAAEWIATALLPNQARIARLRERLEEGILAIDGARIHGAGAERVANTVNAAFAGAPGEVLAASLDLEGVAVSTGAACSSGTVEPSPVLLALGLDAERAREGVRFSLGVDTTEQEIERVLALLPEIVARARVFS